MPVADALMDEAAARLLAEMGQASARLRAHIQQTRFRLETLPFQRSAERSMTPIPASSQFGDA